MPHRPLILLTFASSETSYLEAVTQEMEALRTLLVPEVEKLEFELELYPYTRSETLVDYLNTHRKRLILLHYAGHSNHELLQLDDGMLYAAGLATKLGDFPALQLVVLNGCHNVAQVGLLRQAGVPAVIGTQQPIGDQDGRDFTRAFYTALIKQQLPVSRAFRQAQQDMETLRGQRWRSLDIAAAAEIKDWPWVLEPENVTWKLLDAAHPCHQLPRLPSFELPERPFRGVQHYEERHASIFFGRCRELREVIELLDDMAGRFLLLYGRAGVGKSSFLAAGLLPRLKARQQLVYYCRYNQLDPQQDPLLQIFGSNDPAAIRTLLDQPTASGLPSVCLIDQAEEIFIAAKGQSRTTSPMLGQSLLRVLKEVIQPTDGAPPPNTRVVLSLRKEWLAELFGVCRKEGISQCDYPLSTLNKAAIIEIISSLVRIPALQQAWRLRIEPSADELAIQIADDLLLDQQSSLTTTLQIILERLWSLVEREEKRVWTPALYSQEVRGGRFLENYLDRQLDDMAEREPWGRQARDSGLLLDILFAHSSQQGTSQNLSKAEYRRFYSHVPYYQVIPEVLKQHALLIDAGFADQENGAPTRLAHDILARLVEDRYHA
ncbi:MAG: CHAT domain-containing protein, partial [Thiolinea sp.]